MENQPQSKDGISNFKTCTTGQPKGWTIEEKKRLVVAVKPLIEMQKAYGRVLDMKTLLRGWESVLAEKYTVDQLIWAMKKYALTGGDDFPSPKNLHDMINPPVTYAQYKAAQEVQARNGYPQFSYEATIIRDYHSQQDSAEYSAEEIIDKSENIRSLENRT